MRYWRFLNKLLNLIPWKIRKVKLKKLIRGTNINNRTILRNSNIYLLAYADDIVISEDTEEAPKRQKSIRKTYDNGTRGKTKYKK